MADGSDLLVLGIDPGTTATGYGIVRRHGTRLSAEAWGAWRPARALDRGARLAFLGDRLTEMLAERRPHAVALEQAFLGKNIQSALRLGEARGALLAVCSRAGIGVDEYPTASVKKAVVGHGRADKSQVQFMLQRLLQLREPPRPIDASDALALALTRALAGPLQQISARGPGSRGRR